MIMWEVSLGHMGYVPGVTGEVWQSGPNSAGGVSVELRYKNDTEKTIKYVTFTVVPYNAVKDVQSCHTRGQSEMKLRVTGPINPNSPDDVTFENVWYNSTITTVELTKIFLQYMDGSEETLTGGDIRFEAPPQPPQPSGGCYVATAVYGSYDCPQVWTLRRFRDETLAESVLGRAFIRTYYALSPGLVRRFGGSAWFRKLWRGPLDRLVERLRGRGVEDTPYRDRDW